VTLRMFELAGEDAQRVSSPYCWRTVMAFARKGLAWEGIAWRFFEGERLAPHGSKTVPVVFDGERAVADSWQIALYLDGAYPQAPLFECGQARASGLLLKFWAERTLHPLITRMIVRDIVDVLDPRDRSYFRDTREQRLGATLEAVQSTRDETRRVFKAALEPLRAMLATQPFIGGSAANYADYTVFGAFQWSRCSSPYPLLDQDDPVFAWRERLLDAFGGLARRAVAFDA
jgi:glutathione S-transferase